VQGGIVVNELTYFEGTESGMGSAMMQLGLGLYILLLSSMHEPQKDAIVFSSNTDSF